MSGLSSAVTDNVNNNNQLLNPQTDIVHSNIRNYSDFWVIPITLYLNDNWTLPLHHHLDLFIIIM